MNQLLIFDKKGKLLKSINFKTKSDCKKHKRFFEKNGIIDPNTGDVNKNINIEMI